MIARCIRMLLALALALAGCAARADTPVALFKSFAGNVNFTGAQASMRSRDNSKPCVVVAENTDISANLSGIPAGATVLSAQLYWAGSSSTSDYTVVFEGSEVAAPSSRQYLSHTDGSGFDYFAGAVDVTAQVRAKGNGSYRFHGLAINKGKPYCQAQAVLGGYALLVVYSAAAEPFRVLNLYEGFQYFQYGSLTINLGNFKVPSPLGTATGRVGHITWEGDATLGQNGEQLRFNDVEMIDRLNPSGNQFNSTSNIDNDATSYGIDFDAYTVGDPVIKAGQTSAKTLYQSGQDLVLLNAEIVAVPNVPVADLGIAMIRTTPLSPQQIASYSLTVANNGPSTETGPITVTDTLPAGLAFVSASGAGWTCSKSGQIVSCTWPGSLAANAALAPITLTAMVIGSGMLTNSASVRGQQFDNVSSNDSTSDSGMVASSSYVFTAGACVNNAAFASAQQTCRPYDWASMAAGAAMPNLYVTALAGGVPTALSSTADTTLLLRFALSCKDPSSSAGIQASYGAGATPISLPTCTPNGAPPGSINSVWSPLAGMIFPKGSPSSQLVNFKYNDVGLIQVYMRDAGSAVSAGAPFVSMPAALTVSARQGSLLNPGATSGTGAAFIKAGSVFSMEAGSYTTGGVLTPNFGRESTPVMIEVSMEAGVAGLLVPDLAGEFGPLGATKPGAAVGDAFSWPEVGILKFTAALKGNNNYLGGGALPLTSTFVGRFYPDHFTTAAVATMDCLANMGCPTDPSSPAYFKGAAYSAQPFKLEVTARNAGDAVTINYAGEFARAVGLKAWDAPGSSVTENPPASPSGAVFSAAPIPASAFFKGVSAAASAPLQTYTLPPSAFSSALPHALNWAAPASIYLRAIESAGGDGVSSLLASGSVEGGIRIVSGRLQVENNYGSELLAMPLAVHAQYWTGGARARWENSASDNASTVNPSGASYTNCQKLLRLSPSASTCKNVLAFTTGVESTLVNGAAGFVLKAPGAGNSGSVDIKLNNPAWLPSTFGRAMFGAYKSPLIYVREMY
jgi:MSHA biogenesis protein MshQ